MPSSTFLAASFSFTGTQFLDKLTGTIHSLYRIVRIQSLLKFSLGIRTHPQFLARQTNVGPIKAGSLKKHSVHIIGEGNIGLGDWRYQPMGLFGDISFIIDPYSQARKDAVDFVLNANYGTTTLRKEAFALAKVGGGA